VGRIAVSIEIDATPGEVWAVIEPIENHVQWMSDAIAIRFDDEQRRGVGTRFVCDTRIGPVRLQDHMEVTEWVPVERMGVRHTGIVTGTGAFALTPIDLDRRTRFEWSEDLHFPWWLGGTVGEYLGGNLAMRQIWQRNLRALKRLVEANRS
jgi:Polyketide cyclase / dehydrase and lipid transport